MDLSNNLKFIEGLINQFNKRFDVIRRSRDLLGLVRYPKEHGVVESGKMIAIDGSMDYEERLEMLFFYVNAVGYSTEFSIDDGLRLSNDVRKSSINVSSVIPLWSADIPNLVDEGDEFDARYNLDKIPYLLMCMAELYSTYNAINGYNDLRIILLDRSLVRTYSSLASDLKRLIRDNRSSLLSIDTEVGRLSLLDIRLAYMLGDGSIYTPARGSYARYAIIRELLESEKSKEEVAAKLKIDIDKHIEYWKRQGVFDRADSILRLNDHTKGYWKRVSSTTNMLLEHIFSGKDYPFIIRDRWLTLLDISALNLFLLYDLLSLVLKKGILLIGITKDMNTTEFVRAIIPYHNLSLESSIVSNDRALFSMLSIMHRLDTPWRSIAYDGAFTTLIYDGSEKRLKAARKAILRERLFIRSYFQLRRYKNGLGSPVFMYDRPYYEIHDNNLKEVEAVEWNDISRMSLFLDGSKIDDLCLSILSNLDSKEIYEAYGHNYLLYLADKAAKAEIKHMRAMIRGMADLYIGKIEGWKRLPLSKSFREQRYEMERARE